MFIGQYTADLSEKFNLAHLIETKVYLRQRGPVWHQVDRKAGVVPNHVPTSTLMPLGARVVIMAGLWLWTSHHLYTRCFPNTNDRAKRVGLRKLNKAPEILTQLSPQTLTADDYLYPSESYPSLGEVTSRL